MRRNIIDRMALLCTLHADGPQTLRLLREAGCTTIDKLGNLSAKRVAKLLSLTPAAARRFTREARLLVERLEPTLEKEEVMYPPAAQSEAVKPPPPGLLRVELPDELPAEWGPSSPVNRGNLDVRDRVLVDRVIERWRSEEVDAPGEVPLRQVDVPTAPRSLSAIQGSEPTAEVARQRLKVGELGGLDVDAVERLGLAGITSLEELATCPLDEMRAASGLSFTRARTLQFLAGRQLAEDTARGQVTPPPVVVAPPVQATPRAEPLPEREAAPVAEDELVETVNVEERLSPPAPETRISLGDFPFTFEDEGAGGPFA